METAAGKYRVVKESFEYFVREVDLGGGSCVASHEERVLWVEKVDLVTLLEHKGVVLEELGRYAGDAGDAEALMQEAMKTARWAVDAMRVDAGGDLAIEIWRLPKVVPMVQGSDGMVPAPAGMCVDDEFVDSAWASDGGGKMAEGQLVWSSRWPRTNGEQMAAG